MEKRFAHRKTGKVLAAAAAAAGLVGFAASKADASMVIDVRATSVNGSSAGVDTKLANANVGDVVTFGVFAQISGTNGVNDETITNTQGSFSSVGGLLGNMTNTATATLSASGYSNGTVQDFDSDGDLDVGSTATVSAGKFIGRAAPPAPGTTNLNPNTSEIQVATLTFTVTGGSGTAQINFIPRGGSATQVWNEDAVGTVKNNSNGGVFSVGSPVTVGSVPEPTTIGLLGLASVGLLARRRDKKA